MQEKYLESIRESLALYEKNIFTNEGLSALDNAFDTYEDVRGIVCDTVNTNTFENIFKSYANISETTAQKLFNSIEVDSSQYHSIEFRNILKQTIALYEDSGTIDSCIWMRELLALVSSDSKMRSGKKPKHSKVESSIKLTQKDLIPSIIEILKNHGGSASKRVVEQEMHKKHQREFSKSYFQKMSEGGTVPRWQAWVAWAKERAKKEGFIEWPRESGHGIWKLTDKGMKYKG